MILRNNIFILVAVVILTVVYNGVFEVQEGTRGVVIRLGKFESNDKGDPEIRDPGLNFKMPIIAQVKILDVRLQTLSIESSRIITSEKKDLLVDYYVKWRIQNIPVFYRSTSGGNIRQAEILLEERLNDGLRAEFGKRTIQEVVSEGRLNLMYSLRKQINQSVEELGIELRDFRVKRIDLPSEVSASVYERMRTERYRVATEHRSEGKAKAEAIRADADAEVRVTLAEANGLSKQIIGEGDSEAANILANSYSKSPEFFSFYRRMEAYNKSFDGSDLLLINPNGEFFTNFAQISSESKSK